MRMELLPDAAPRADGWRSLLKPGQSLRHALGQREIQCPQHGAYTSTGTRYFQRTVVWTPCPECEKERLAARQRRQAQELAQQQRAQLENMLGQAQIPARFIGRTFDNFEADTPEKQKALATVREFADNFEGHLRSGASLALLGKPGTGKSHLAAAVLQAIMPTHCGLYVTCMQVVRAVRGTWRRDSERSESDVYAQLAEVPLLVLDEVGVQYGTEGEQTILFEVLDRRYRDMMPTMLLANQNLDGLKHFLGERVYDRLTETARVVMFGWDSYRKQARGSAA